jgi:hypothetical protein
MRTTITLDDRLLDELRNRAAASGTTVSRLVEHAVRLFIGAPTAPKEQAPFELVTFGRGGQFTRQNADKTACLIEGDDIARHRRP